MGKYIFILLMLILHYTANAQSIEVVASTTIFADMASVIGGDKVNVQSIVAVGTDPHTYEPVPQDVAKIKDADVILLNALTLEGWIQKLITNSGTDAYVQVITDGVKPIASKNYKNAYDPHAWMTALNGIVYIENIYNALIKVDPKNQDYYYDNFINYRKELKELHNYIEESILKIPIEKRLLVTSHDAFAYFGREYGILVSAIKGISTDSEARTSDIIRVKEEIARTGVPAIFIESTINPKTIKQIAKDSGVKIGGELFSDSLGESGGEGDTYLKMLRHNTDVIVQALSVAPAESDDNQDGSQDSTPSWMYILLGAFMLSGIFIMINKLNP